MGNEFYIDVFLNMYSERSHVGRLAEYNHSIYFEYAQDCLQKHIELSPFKLPLGTGVFTDVQRTFDGLPGLFNDSMPDGWGVLLLDRILKKQRKSVQGITPLHRLALAGRDCVGALEYESAIQGYSDAGNTVHNLDTLSQQSEMLLADGTLSPEDLFRLFCLSGSSAGARPKVLVTLDANQLVCARGKNGEQWLIKFKAKEDPPDIGPIEYAYSLAAKEAGVEMPETRLFPAVTGPGYFGVKRFDRTDTGEKIHVHTACGLLHASHRYPSLSYEDLIKLTMVLTRDAREALKMVKLMVFNVLSGNKDDHSKNFSFFLDKNRDWHMAPAYDLTPSAGFQGEHACTVNGKGKNITDHDLISAATVAGISRRSVQEIIERTKDALANRESVLQSG